MFSSCHLCKLKCVRQYLGWDVSQDTKYKQDWLLTSSDSDMTTVLGCQTTTIHEESVSPTIRAQIVSGQGIMTLISKDCLIIDWIC